jgi:hypothetical protein
MGATPSFRRRANAGTDGSAGRAVFLLCTRNANCQKRGFGAVLRKLRIENWLKNNRGGRSFTVSFPKLPVLEKEISKSETNPQWEASNAQNVLPPLVWDFGFRALNFVSDFVLESRMHNA